MLLSESNLLSPVILSEAHPVILSAAKDLLSLSS